VVAYVPSASVKDVITQLDIDGKRAKWIAKLIEFNRGEAHQVCQRPRLG